VFGAVAGLTTGQDAIGRYRGLLGIGRSGKGALHYGVFVCCTELVGVGGEGGIRTPDTVARMPHFECGAFDHSATSPN
jgi:hypothetical protein